MEIVSVMTKPVLTAGRKASVKDAVKKMALKGVSCIVVAEKKIPIGIFTKFDLLGSLDAGYDLNKTPLEKVMHTPVMPVEENENLFTAARQMEQLAVRRFIVVDGGNRITGIVTNSDIVRAFADRSFSYTQPLGGIAEKGLTAAPKTPLAKIARMMIEARSSCVTVLKAGKPAGVVTDAGIVKLAAKSAHPLAGTAEEKMAKKFVVAQVIGSVRETVVKMVKSGHKEIVLVNEDGRYYGIITQKELAHFIEISRE